MTAGNGQERSFGLTVGTVAGLLASVSLWRGRSGVAAALALTAVTLVGTALWAPAVLRGPRAGWMRLAHGLAWVNTRVLLTTLFVGLLTPVGLVLRLGRWDPLGRRRRAEGTGWVAYPERRRDPHHYEKLY